MTTFLSTALIGISCYLSVPGGIESISLHDDVAPFVASLPEYHSSSYRRFVPEHQMWCYRGPEISLGVKTNLLYWTLATPNAGVELFWRRRWSLSVEGAYARWLYNKGTKFYYLAAVSPELRYWLHGDGHFNGHYIGAGLHLGQYDIQFGRTGEQADFFGAGFSYGYALPVNKYMNIEFGFGVGFINRDYVKYETAGNEFVRTGAGQKLWLGPTRANISCVWHIGNKRRVRK